MMPGGSGQFGKIKSWERTDFKDFKASILRLRSIPFTKS
jgi:hypothetical protein